MTLLVLLEWLGKLYEADALVAGGTDDAIVEMYRECLRSKRHATELRKPAAATRGGQGARAGDVPADESGYEDAASWLRGDGVRHAGAWFGRWAGRLGEVHAGGDLADDDRGDDPVDDHAERRPPARVCDEVALVLPEVLESVPGHAGHEQPR
jgi:hypothetical protein